MFHGSHETYVDALKRHMKAWKMRGPAGDGSKGAYSDATICDLIIQKHEEIGGPAKTGIVFAPGSADEFNRRKANAVRIMRMLTDEPHTEFEGLQLFNFAPSILAAMPRDLSISFASEYFRDAGLSVHLVEEAGHEDFSFEVAADTQSAACDAMKAMTAAILDPTPENLAIAEREADKAHVKFKRTKAFLAKTRAKFAGAIHKVCHRKDKVQA